MINSGRVDDKNRLAKKLVEQRIAANMEDAMEKLSIHDDIIEEEKMEITPEKEEEAEEKEDSEEEIEEPEEEVEDAEEEIEETEEEVEENIEDEDDEEVEDEVEDSDDDEDIEEEAPAVDNSRLDEMESRLNKLSETMEQFKQILNNNFREIKHMIH